MAVTGAVVGAGMIAAGTAAAIRAQRMKTKARGVNFGGSADATNSMRETYATGADQGNASIKAADTGLRNAGINANRLAGQGQSMLQAPVNVGQAQQVSGIGMGLLNSYQPGQVAAAQTQQVLDQNAANTLGAARSGGALGLRNAIGANAQAGMQASQGLAVQRAQEEQALLQAKVGQANLDRGLTMDQVDQVTARQYQADMADKNIGAQLQSQGNQLGLASSQARGQLGLANQGQFLNQLSDVNSQQMASDLDYERRRQADQQRKSQNVWGLAQGLIGGGAKALGGAGG